MDTQSLCQFCSQVNFAAILTPRECDKQTWHFATIYRPELTRTSEKSLTQEWYDGKTVRTGPPEDWVPQIRTAEYNDLSASEDENENTDSDAASAREGSAADDGWTNALDRSESLAQTMKLRHGSAIGAGDSDSEVEVEDHEEDVTGEKKETDSMPSESSESISDAVQSVDSSSIATWSGNSHFTEIDRIDIKKQAEGNWNYRPGHLYYLGTIWDVRSRRKSCVLCKRFWQSMRNDFLVKRCFMTKSRCILKLMDFKTERKTRDQSKEINVMQLIFIYGAKLDDPNGYNWIVKTPLTIQAKCAANEGAMHPTDKEIFDDRNYGLARDCTNTCKFELFKCWLRMCERDHQHPISSVDFSNFEFRLIDVEQECLVYAEKLDEPQPRYIALSYVWGQAKQHRLLIDNQYEALEPGYFSMDEIDLPATIKDAFIVTKELGERYLWIDALCIVQDSSFDKREQIPRMHDIYGSAVLTIVAAGSESADDHLAGVWSGRESDPMTRNRLEELELEVKGTRIVVRSAPSLYGTEQAIGLAEDYLKAAESAWTTRCWTYQEGMLSQRLLIFTNSQVLWECSCATWEEQTCWESSELQFCGFRSVKNVTPMDIWADAFDRRAHDITSLEEDEDEYRVNIDQESYPRLVREYTSRQLTSQKDILGAFTGILQSIVEKEETQFFHALRTKHFGNDLLFNINNVLPRRFALVQKHPRRFPLWSWLAWGGKVEIANDARGNSWDLVRHLTPCDGVKCFVVRDVDEDGEEWYLENLNPDGGWKFDEDYVRRGEGIWDPTTYHRSNDGQQPRPALDSRGSGSRSPQADAGSQANKDILDNQDLKGTTESADEASDTRDLDLDVVDTLGKVKLEDEKEALIPSYPQDLDRQAISIHPAWPVLRFDFHIIFATFVSTVVLRTEWDELNAMLSGVVMGGTKRTRGEGIWANRGEPYARSLYAVRDRTYTDEMNLDEIVKDDSEDEEPCPCCGKVEKPYQLPPDKEQGAYMGKIPPLSKSWNPTEYREFVPDGIYKLLFMNNNQLPMWGHLLVKDELDGDGHPTGVLERVCCATGPTDILTREAQLRYGAEWQICVLG